METLTVALGEVTMKKSYAMEEDSFADTSRQRYLNTTVPVLTWSVTTTVMRRADMLELQAFNDRHYDGFTAFLWTCPLDGVTRSVRFVKDSFAPKSVNACNWQASFSLRTG